MGTISRSWALVKQSFQILRADKELMLLPVLSAVSCLLVTGVVIGGGAFALFPVIKSSLAENPNWQPSTPMVVAGTFVFYAVNYCVIVFFNTALVGAASIRLEGGDPTLQDGLRIAWQRKWRILEWALLSATVGVILKMLEERLSFLGRIVVRLIGLAWTLASYFVVPVLALEDVGPVDALKRSAELFRKNWGEQVTGGFSFGLIFFALAVPGIAFPVVGLMLGAGIGLFVGLAVMVLYFLLLAVVSAATQGIFAAALYRYAKSGEVSTGYSAENFSMAWQPK